VYCDGVDVCVFRCTLAGVHETITRSTRNGERGRSSSREEAGQRAGPMLPKITVSHTSYSGCGCGLLCVGVVLGDKDPSAVVSVPDNLSTTPTVTPTSVGVGSQHILMVPPGSPPATSTSGTMVMGGTMATGGSRPDEEEIGERGRQGVASDQLV